MALTHCLKHLTPAHVAFAILLLILIGNATARSGRLWLRVTYEDNVYRVRLSSKRISTNQLCILLLCYYARLRTTIRDRYCSVTLQEFDQATSITLAQLAEYARSGAAHSYENPVLSTNSIRERITAQSFYAELMHRFGSFGAADYSEHRTNTKAVSQHYCVLLRVVWNSLSNAHRAALFATLTELMTEMQAAGAPSGNAALGIAFVNATRSFRARLVAVNAPDRIFSSKDCQCGPSMRLALFGYNARIPLKLLAIAAPVEAYTLTGRWESAVAIGFPIYAALWTMAGVLTAVPIGLRDGREHWTSAMLSNALYKHGGQFRRWSTALIFFTFIGFFNASFVSQGLEISSAIVGVLVGGVLTELWGYSRFVKLLAAIWCSENSHRSALSGQAIRRELPALSYRLMCLTLTNFTVFVPYAAGLYLLIFLLSVGKYSWLVATLDVAVTAYLIRAGIPMLIKCWHAGRHPYFRAVLLRKFFAPEQSVLLRNMVAPTVGVYGDLVTVYDPAYRDSREASIGLQEEAASINDVLGQFEKAIKCTNENWKPTVRTALKNADLALIDVTRPTPSLTWELAESLNLLPTPNIILLSSLEATTGHHLAGLATLVEHLRREIVNRKADALAGEIRNKFEEIAPPLVYARFPSSFLFRAQLAKRMSKRLSRERSKII